MKVQIPDYQLNHYLGQVCPCFEAASRWERMNDLGNVEIYVGDGTYVIAVIHMRPCDIPDITEIPQAALRVRQNVLRYLTGEGFIGKDYIYIALQELDLPNS